MIELAAPFGVRWLRSTISDPTNQHEGSPVFQTFDPTFLEAGKLPFYSLTTGERLLSRRERADREAERAACEAERANQEAAARRAEAEARQAAEAELAKLRAESARRLG